MVPSPGPGRLYLEVVSKEESIKEMETTDLFPSLPSPDDPAAMLAAAVASLAAAVSFTAPQMSFTAPQTALRVPAFASRATEAPHMVAPQAFLALEAVEPAIS